MDIEQELDKIEEQISWGFWKTVLVTLAIGYVVFLIYGNLHRDGAILREVRPAFLFGGALFRMVFPLIVSLIVGLVARILRKDAKKPFVVAFIVLALLTMYGSWNTSPF